MSEITAVMVNELRQMTGAGLMDCKRALVEANGNTEEAITILKKKGIASAAKKADRAASEGIVQSYIHNGGRVGVLIQLNCETDFVAKNETFSQLARDISMHIAALSPLYISNDEIPADLVEKEKAIVAAQCEGKPANAIEKIISGKLTKWYAEICLLDQPFVKNQDITVGDYIKEMVSKMGENIKIGKFARFQIGA